MDKEHIYKSLNTIYSNLRGKELPSLEKNSQEFKAINKNDRKTADDFFGKYGVGNSSCIHKPIERQSIYEYLLLLLEKIDFEHYKAIHKGTPFYFIGWTAYQCRDFSKAMFYMDAALNEDLLLGRELTAAISFFRLSTDSFEKRDLPAHCALIQRIEEALEIYKSENTKSSYSLTNLQQRFISKILITEAANSPESVSIPSSSILTALYFFISEYECKRQQIQLRNSESGTCQPFINHLFDGARILESLLELKSKEKNLHKKIRSLKRLDVGSLSCSNKSLRAAIDCQRENLTIQKYHFKRTCIIRNTTAHSLLWNEQFNSINEYESLFSSLIFSIFWTIEKLW